MGEVISFPIRRCKCGWAMPNHVSYTLKLAPRPAAVNVELLVDFECPICGHEFEVVWPVRAAGGPADDAG